MKKHVLTFSLLLGIALGVFLMSRPRPETPREPVPVASSDGAASRAPGPQTPESPNQPVTTDPKIGTLKEILAARNDGDPRLDTDFNDLTPDTKERMRSLYRSLAPEKLNDKGTIVFLLGRNLVNEIDFEFFDEVLLEPVCRSLSDCGRSPASATSEEVHMEAGTEVTLAYPQLVAIKAFERMLEDGTTPAGLVPEIQKRLENAKRSTVPVVARQAEQALIKTSGG